MRKEKIILLFGLALLLFLVLGKAADIYGELLWFQGLGYSSVFWTILLTKGLTAIALGTLFFLVAGLNLYLARKTGPSKKQWELSVRRQGMGGVETIPIRPEYVNRLLLLGCLVLSVFMGIWPAGMKWDEFLRFWYQTPFSRLDPIFHRDIGYFVFSYPVMVFMQKWLFYTLLITTGLVGYIYSKDGEIRLKLADFMFTRRAKAHLSVLASLLLLLFAWDKRLKMLGLLYSSRGVVFGASYTDMHAQLIAYWILFIIAGVCAFLFWINISSRGWKWPLIGLASLFVLSILVNELYPWALQQFIVEPNELAKERPYIQHNIQYTRLGYNLDKIEEKNFQALTNLSLADIQKNALTLRNVKLWDKKPLKQTYSELQEMRLYYNFINVDEDRYILNGEHTQVMLSPRELNQSQLPEQARTWENEHFKYTHGYGLCMSPVNSVTEKGLPNLVIKNIPPVSEVDLKVRRPEVYYGERANDFVIVNTASPEFDYPRGDTNVYTNYQGKGGVRVGSYLHRLIFSLKFSDFKILLTSYVKPESRIMFHREIRDMVRTLAPFLIYDRDPYPVVSSADGHIYWIQDAYTTTDKYPYSEQSMLVSADDSLPLQGGGPLPMLLSGRQPGAGIINYIRNSVKVVIDAYDGTAIYYVVDQEDPIIQTYQKMFPALFRPFSEMPQDLRSHIRYPKDLFEIQANMYQLYHMQDAQVFYNKEDQWDLPRQKGLSDQEESPMEGYYLTMRLPEQEKEEFLLMVPFTPNNKSNMIAWICARCDGPDYGKLLVYKFPKEKLIYGPRQVEARIDQQTEISRELTLWSQQGSQVFRGDLLVIPIERAILYIEPVYLVAAGESQLPELKRVIVAYGDKIEMKPTLPEAMQAVFGQEMAEAAPPPPPPAQQREPAQIPGGGAQSLNDLARQADQYFQKALESLRNGNWAQYGQYQDDLGKVIQELLKASEGK
ncbi:MAG: UPF0182 family protein [bacterium]